MYHLDAFDAERMARDGLMIRDGCHMKAHDAQPLLPYLLLAATWETAGLPSPVSTLCQFSGQADRCFAHIPHRKPRSFILLLYKTFALMRA